jgi:hypothetical protein
MIVKVAVFEDFLHKLDDKQTLTCSTLAKQYKVSFFIGLLAIHDYPLNFVQKSEVIRILIIYAASLVDKTL